MNEEFSSCIICGSKKLEKIQGYEKDFLIVCSNCSFVFSKKIPTQNEIISVYQNYPRKNVISDITVKRYQEILIDLLKYRKTNNIIDVGAGDGHFAEVAKSNGWNVYATEFDDVSVNLCRQKGVTTNIGVLDASNYEDSMFDLIFSLEVIEHINNPVEEVNKFRKILRKGGGVYVTTPNFKSLSHDFLKANWNIFNYPEHLCYYTPKTIEKLFVNNGFKKVWIKTTGVSVNRFFQSQGKTIEIDNDDILRQKTEKKIVWSFAKSAANKVLNLTKKGDSLKAFFIKM
jgi:ubiquinone/menaquinone biosynthesis C-methylase UbiE